MTFGAAGTGTHPVVEMGPGTVATHPLEGGGNGVGGGLGRVPRMRILLSPLEPPGYPAELAQELELTRTNVSNHLACLRGCGLVIAEPEGRRTRYEIADALGLRARALAPVGTCPT